MVRLQNLELKDASVGEKVSSRDLGLVEVPIYASDDENISSSDHLEAHEAKELPDRLGTNVFFTVLYRVVRELKLAWMQKY